MIRLRTLRAKFALWTSGVLIAALTLFGVYVYESMSHRMAKALDDSLAFGAAQVLGKLEFEHGAVSLTDNALQPAEVNSPATRFSVRILTANQRNLLQTGRSYALPAPVLDSTEPYFSTITDTSLHEPVRVYTMPQADYRGRPMAVIQVAQSLKEINETLRRLLLTLAFGVPLLAVMAGFSGFYLAKKALAPIDQIASAALKISAANLGARLNLPATNDEVGRLATTFDGMLERLNASFLRERRFTSDASHELRTPLAAMLAILDSIRQRRRTPEEYEHALAGLSEEVSRLRMLTESLLLLARGDAGKRASHVLIDLTELLQNVTDSMRPIAEAKHISIVCEIPGKVEMVADGDALLRLFFNLMDNAVKYTNRGGILVKLERNPNHIRIAVSDTGQGIPEEDLPYVFDRFYRVDKARSQGGSGLGLSIAREIVKAHAGELKAHSVLGKGSTFEVVLPF